ERQVDAVEPALDPAPPELVRREPARADPAGEVAPRLVPAELEGQHAVDTDPVVGVVHARELDRGPAVRALVAGQRAGESHVGATVVAGPFARAGEPGLALRAALGDPPQRAAVVALADAGLGIDLEHLDVPAVRAGEALHLDRELEVRAAAAAGEHP